MTLSIEQITHVLELAGAKDPTLDKIAATNADLWDAPPPDEFHTRVESVVAELVADPVKLTKQLRTIAEEHATATALADVRHIAALQHDAAASNYVNDHIDELIGAAGTALQPELDRFVAVAKELPKHVNREEFPVTASWTGRQHEAWLSVAPLVEKVEELRRLLAPVYGGMTSRWLPERHAAWFALLDPSDAYAGVADALNADIHRASDYSMGTTAQVFELVSIAHLVGREGASLALVGPTEARARLARFEANAQRSAPRATPHNDGRNESALYVGQLLRGAL